MTHPHPNRRFVPQAVLMNSGKINTAGASGNPQQKEYKEKGVINSGCSRNMTGNKCYLTEYEDYDGGFVSFGEGKVNKAMRVFNKRTRIVKETLNITFLENTPNVIGNGPDWLFDVDSLTISMNYVPVVAGNQTTDPKVNEEDAEEKPTEMDENGASDKDGKDDQATRSDFERLLQQEKQIVHPNNTNSINTVSTPVSAARPSFTNDDPSSPVNAAEASNAFEDQLFEQFSPFKNAFTLPPVSNVTPMDDTRIFCNAYDDEDMDVEVDLNNLETTMNDRRNQPPGFEDPQFPNKVYKVEKALYGLHQAPKAWYETLSTYLIENGFRRGTIDKTLFIKKDKGLMHKRFQMSSIGELTFFLGLQVQQKKDGIFISQDKYVADILKKFDFATMKTTSTPMEPNKALVKDEEADSVDVYLYRSVIGSLMYLTASRPDIMFVVCACARFQVTPKMSHLHAMKRIFRYLKGQPKLGLWYPRDSPFDLEVFSDSDYARASLDMKSIIGGCQFLGKRLISWQCKKQTIVANSTTKAEYVATANCYETVYKEWEDRMERAATTASSLDAEQDSGSGPRCQDTILGGADAQTRFETASKQSNDPPLSRGYTLGSGEDSMKLLELMELCIKLSYLKKQSRRKQQKTTLVPHPSDSTADVPNEESVPTHSNDPLLSGEDRLKLTDLMDMCTKLSERVLDLEHTKTAQAQEITNLKLRVKKLEKKAGMDASKQGRSIADIDKDVKVSLVDETQGRSDDAEMFDTDALIGNEVFAKNDMIEKDQDMIPKEVSTAAPSTTAVSPTVITKVEITLAQTLAKFKSAKSKVVIQEPVQSIATTSHSTIPKAKGITFRDAGESTPRIPTSVSSSSIKDKGKAKMDEPEVPFKKKDQIALDEEMARNLEAQIQAKLIEEERLARKKKEEVNIALIESWDNTQAMMEANFELAQRLQVEEQREITFEKRSRLFVELMNKRKKHFAKLKAEEKRRKPPTKAQKRNLMSTYLKNMGGYKYNQLKSKSYDEIQKLFDNEMKRVNTFIPMDSEKAEGGRKKSIGKKRKGNEQKQESSKRQRIEDDKETNEHEEVREDDESEMKKYIEVVQDDEEIAIDAIPLATKPPIIVEYKIVKEGQKGFYHLIRADGSSNRYSSMIRML
ncbi:uncharacterized mitochondrial protein-like protein [Tanacetum coccineum]